jgi:hypothetical protein
MSTTENEIVNRVAQSKLITLDIDELLPLIPIVHLDILSFSEGGLLREKVFREQIKNHDWSQYRGKIVNVYCGDEAIVPLWAYMIVGAELGGNAELVISCEKNEAARISVLQRIEQMDLDHLTDNPIVLKGCNRPDIGPEAYVILAHKIQGIASSLLFGEACSSVPVYKKKKPTRSS